MAINQNVENVRFLRNGSVFTPSVDPAKTAREVALAAMEEQKDNLADGVAILGRYQETSGTVKTLVGFAYISGETKTLTIFDVDGASADVEALRQEINAKLGGGITSENTATAQLAALSGDTASTSADTSVEGAKRYADAKVSEAIDRLEYTGVTTGDGKVIVNVTEADGIVSGATAEVGGLKLTNYSKGSDSGAVATTDSINSAISKLENQVDAEAAARAAAIDALDYTDTAATKQFIAKVDETNGVISVERGELQSSGKTIVITADGNNVNFEANIDGQSIVKDANGVLSVASTALTQYVGDEKTIHISSADTTTNTKTVSSLLTISATTPTGTNVKEQYNLVNASGETIGDTIKIYKDSSLYSAYLGHTDDTIAGDPPVVTPGTGDAALCFIYHKEDGSYELVAVNVESFLEESEFASGVTADSSTHIVHGVVDPTSESFLTVGTDGFKITGVSGLVESAIEDLDATVNNSGTSGHVGVEVVEENGKLTAITVSENDIASQAKLNELSGKTITEVESSNSSISAVTAATTDGTVKVDLTTDASKIKMTGFTADASGFTAITSASTITEAVKAIETEVVANELVVSTALNDLNDRVDTVSGDVNTISGDVNTLKTNYISGVSVNGSATTVTDHVAGFNITSSSAATTASTSNAIVVQTDANGNITLGLNYIDCGTY